MFFQFFMPDANPDQPTPEESPKTVTISLKDMAQRYLGAMQRTYDTAAMVATDLGKSLDCAPQMDHRVSVATRCMEEVGEMVLDRTLEVTITDPPAKLDRR